MLIYLLIGAIIFSILGDDYLTPSGGFIRPVNDAGILYSTLFDRHNPVFLKLLIEELKEFLHKPFVNKL